MSFRDQQTPNKKTRSDPGLDQVKMDVSVVNGSKSRCILVVLSLAKQPPRGPFARELRNQTGAIMLLRRRRLFFSDPRFQMASVCLHVCLSVTDISEFYEEHN